MQGLLGYDRPHAVGGREQILIFRGAQIVLLRRLDSHFGRVEPGREQPVLHVIGMDMAAFALIGPGAFDLDQQDRADIAPGIGVQAAGFRVERVQLDEGRVEGGLPVIALARVEVEWHFDHAFPVQLPAGDFDK